MNPCIHNKPQRSKMPLAFGRMEVAASRDLALRFNNLLHQIRVDLLETAFHKLDAKKASGIDGMTKQQYGENLEVNLKDLENRIHQESYRPRPSRQVLIPKGNGKTRPITICNLEDKIVQTAVAMILEALYEPLFNQRSLGFRPRRGAHQALRTAYRLLEKNERPIVIECDLEKCFDSIEHDKLIELMQKRIVDPRFLRLTQRLMKTEVKQADSGKIVKNLRGTPQGSVVSPILANIYLHYVLDSWFEKNFAHRYQTMIRYADDVTFCFKKPERALSFLRSLKSRLTEFKLSLNPDKTKIVDFSKDNHQVINLLGFTFYWGKDRKKRSLLKLKTRSDRFRDSVQDFKMWIKMNRNRFKLKTLWEKAAEKLRGHYAYYGVTFNKRTSFFYITCLKLLFKWLNRRSQKHSFSRRKFQQRLLHNPLPKPWGYQALNLTQGMFEYAI